MENSSGNSSYAPFMFGGHPPVSHSATNFRNDGSFGRSFGRNESVRDCMVWTNSLDPQLQNNSNYSWGGAGAASFQNMSPTQAAVEMSMGSNLKNQSPQFTTPQQPQFQSPQFAHYEEKNSVSHSRTVSKSEVMKPVAYMSIPGQGGEKGSNGGEMSAIQIPVHVGVSGTQFGPLPPMEPIYIKTAAPTSGNGVGQPYTFTISPEQYYQMQRK